MKKIDKLIEIIKEKKSLVVAFSGGVDSSLVSKVAFEILKGKAVAITVNSDIFPEKDLIFSQTIAKEIGIKHIIVEHSKTGSSNFINNSKDRCYYCKKEEIDLIEKIALENNIKNIAYGVNASDQNEHRPGISALKEKGVFFPLQIVGIEKSEIPHIAKQLGLSNYKMPSTTCLASRIPYGITIDKKKLNQIEESEIFIINLGINDSRVRHHGDIARIEVAENEFDIILSNKNIIIKKFNDLGFKYISLDLQGYRSGSMDEVL